MSPSGGQYLLTVDELTALAGLMGRQIMVGVHVDGEPDAAHGIQTLLSRGLAAQDSEDTLRIPEDLEFCLDTVFAFDAYLSCTGWDRPKRASTLGVFVRSGSLVALSEEPAGRYALRWIPVLPLAIGAVAAYAEAVDRDEAGDVARMSAPVADPAGFRDALAERNAGLIGSVLAWGGWEASQTAALAEELAFGTTRRFVGVSAFGAPDDLDLTLVTVGMREYAVAVRRDQVEVATVNAVSANHLIARWLSHACSQSLAAAEKKVAQ